MLRVVLLAFALGSVDPIPARAREDEAGEATVSELLREVNALMRDTEDKLQNAVKEIKAEEENAARKLADVDFEKLPPSYHNESNTETQIGNKTIHTHQEIDKECMIDEDCDNGKYCQLANFEYKCLACKTQDDCSRDGECCGGQLCVWGQCTLAASKGENGTICENQQECNPGLCCAIHKNLLFPVCTPLPEDGEFCHDSSNKILEQIEWQLEPDGVFDRCPCAAGLYCRSRRFPLIADPNLGKHKNYPTVLSPGTISPNRYGLISVCEHEPLNGTRDADMEIPLEVEAFPFLAVADLEAEKIIEEVESELLDHEKSIGLQMDSLVPDLPFEEI
uniref:Dickkopf-related protein 3 n=1 Tax=Geotrypetes seraphini TaxID=260995 RepID=A0A6P8P4X2_GEOSA|nr:dickkopf-related protein 3 isoform X2 [Geotrypetes seraphini]